MWVRYHIRIQTNLATKYPPPLRPRKTMTNAPKAESWCAGGIPIVGRCLGPYGFPRGGGRFLMSKVPLYGDARAGGRVAAAGPYGRHCIGPYRGTSLIRNDPRLEPYNSPTVGS